MLMAERTGAKANALLMLWEMKIILIPGLFLILCDVPKIWMLHFNNLKVELLFITLQTNLQYAPTQNYQRTADLIVKAEWYVWFSRHCMIFFAVGTYYQSYYVHDQRYDFFRSVTKVMTFDIYNEVMIIQYCYFCNICT